MKAFAVVILILLTVFITNAFASNVRCYDGIRHIAFSKDAHMTLNGFDSAGTPSGSIFKCQNVEQNCSAWLDTSHHLCHGDDGDFTLQIFHVMGVRTALLYSSSGQPYFMGICSAFQISY